MPKRPTLVLPTRDVRRVPASERNDGWKNLVTLLGTSADKRTASAISWEYRSPEFFEQLYAGGGIPARIVDLVPEEALREWVEWMDLDPDQKSRVEDRCEELDARGAFLKSWKWARAYGGGLCHIVTDTSDPASPLRRGENVIGLRDLSRWDVRVLTTDIEYDFGSPNWGHPRIYYLNVQMGSQYKGYPIHWTRMIRFDGQLVPRRTYIRNNYWHDSILNRLYDTIRDYQMSNEAAAACLQDFNVDVYKMKNLADLVASGKESIVRSRMDVLNYGKSVLNAMLIDADDEDYENKGRSLEGVAELLKHQANRLVAETDIPHTKLLGESPDGSNATGNSTSQQWYNFISAEQKNYAKTKLARLISVLIPEVPKLNFYFRGLRVLDDLEKAQLRYQNAQADQIYIEQGVLDPSEVADSRFGGEEYSNEIELDLDARAQGLIPVSHDAGVLGQEHGGNQDLLGSPQSTTGRQPPEGGDDLGPSSSEPGAPPKESQGAGQPQSETEPGPMRGHEGTSRDITGRETETHPMPDTKEIPAEGQGVEGVFLQSQKPGAQFDFRNRNLAPTATTVPKDKAFISQMMSTPFRDPRTDPHLKGPGIPNRQRTILPTRGTGVVAPSGASPLDAGISGAARENGSRKDSDVTPSQTDAERADYITQSGDKWIVHAESGKHLGEYGTKAAAEKRLRQIEYFKHNDGDTGKAATVIVKRGDHFLMGKRADNGRWTLPGGMVELKESHHQGAIRELSEETGAKAEKLKFRGSKMVEPEQGKTVHVNVYEYNADAEFEPTASGDPDQEIAEFQWVPIAGPLPEEIGGNLQHPNNIALDALGLLR